MHHTCRYKRTLAHKCPKKPKDSRDQARCRCANPGKDTNRKPWQALRSRILERGEIRGNRESKEFYMYWALIWREEKLSSYSSAHTVTSPGTGPCNELQIVFPPEYDQSLHFFFYLCTASNPSPHIIMRAQDLVCGWSDRAFTKSNYPMARWFLLSSSAYKEAKNYLSHQHASNPALIYHRNESTNRSGIAFSHQKIPKHEARAQDRCHTLHRHRR